VVVRTRSKEKRCSYLALCMELHEEIHVYMNEGPSDFFYVHYMDVKGMLKGIRVKLGVS
jgi:hypothetical protein